MTGYPMRKRKLAKLKAMKAVAAACKEAIKPMVEPADEAMGVQTPGGAFSMRWADWVTAENRITSHRTAGCMDWYHLVGNLAQGNSIGILLWQRFLVWLREQCVTMPAAKMGCDSIGRGIFATKPIAAGELAIHVPRSAIITTETAKASDIGRRIADANVHTSDYGHHAAFLLEINTIGGFWKPFIDTMPMKHSEHPLFFTEEEKAYLKGSSMLPLLQSKQEWIEYDYDQIASCMPEGRMWPKDDFAQAVCTTMTRTYELVIDGGQTTAWVPFAELMNHSNSANISWSGEASWGFVATASETIEAGNPMHISYGARGNSALFVYHGFCLENNPYNDAEILLPALKEDHPLYECTKELGTEREAMRAFKLLTDYQSDGSAATFSFLRLSCVDEVPEMWRVTLAGIKPHEIPPLSRRNEIAVLTRLSTACEEALEQYDTTLEQDEELLKANQLPRKLHYAVMGRSSEKRVLEHYIDLAQTAIPILQDPLSVLAEHAAAEKPFAGYFAHLDQHLKKESAGNQ